MQKPSSRQIMDLIHLPEQLDGVLFTDITTHKSGNIFVMISTAPGAIAADIISELEDIFDGEIDRGETFSASNGIDIVSVSANGCEIKVLMERAPLSESAPREITQHDLIMDEWITKDYDLVVAEQLYGRVTA